MLSYKDYLERRDRRRRLQQSGSFVGEGGAPSYPSEEEIAALNERRQQEHNELLRAEELRGAGSSVEPYVDVDPVGEVGPVKSFAEYLEERRRHENEDGTFSTERTITVYMDESGERDPALGGGWWVNIPTLYGGEREPVSQPEAISIIAANGLTDPDTGRQLERFDSVEAAVASAKARSDSLGATGEAGLTSDISPVFSGSRTPMEGAPPAEE